MSRAVEGATPRYRDEAWLREQYVERERSTRDIAERCDVRHRIVIRWIDCHEIETQNRSLLFSVDERIKDREWVYEQYVGRGRSTISIADECGCGQSIVIRWLQRHQIKTGEGDPTSSRHPYLNTPADPYGTGWNDEKRRRVRERDDHTCQHSGCAVTNDDHRDRHGESLHVHHIRKAREFDDPEPRNAMENLVTLCRPHHRHYEQIADAGLTPTFEGVND